MYGGSIWFIFQTENFIITSLFFYKTKSNVFQIFESILIKADNTFIDAVKERKGRIWQLEGRFGKILT